MAYEEHTHSGPFDTLEDVVAHLEQVHEWPPTIAGDLKALNEAHDATHNLYAIVHEQAAQETVTEPAQSEVQ